jgi:hypothetical protein
LLLFSLLLYTSIVFSALDIDFFRDDFLLFVLVPVKAFFYTGAGLTVLGVALGLLGNSPFRVA